MSDKLRRFVEEFFRNLKCDFYLDGDILVVKTVPRSFEDLIGRSPPYRFSFIPGVKGADFVGKGSLILNAMTKYLDGAGRATILKIDFEVDPEVEIKKRVGLKDCEIVGLSRGYRNNFFSRFSFVSTFNYLNESEKVLSEIYIHGGKVVEGDLSGYTVLDGKDSDLGNRYTDVDKERVKEEYKVAKEKVVELVSSRQKRIGEILKKKVEAEIARISKHYDEALRELGGDLNGRLEKIREVEILLRSCNVSKRPLLRKRLGKLRAGLIKVGDDESVKKVLEEREMTIKDILHKFSLNVDRKLVNTTVIYYPVYDFKIYLEGEKGKKYIEVSYDPLTKKFEGLNCESCGDVLLKINLCEGGHISCDKCLARCGGCGGSFCLKCLGRSCESCGVGLCRDCLRICRGCGGVVCKDHLRVDCVSGEDRCISCLRACLRCRGLSEERFFGEAMDGSKVCGKCLGKERSSKVLEKVFRR